MTEHTFTIALLVALPVFAAVLLWWVGMMDRRK